MISPSIWESDSFSDLSDLAKIVFISLFSHADDEGRGKAKASYIRSITFPNDENRRDADIKKALSEIALHMSVQFYKIGGIEYYVMTNWNDYQTINKPTKSKYPPPPFVGEGGAIHSDGKLPQDYGSTTVGLPQDYDTKKEIEDKENINNTHSAGAREEESADFIHRFNVFCEKWDIERDTNLTLTDFDFNSINRAFAESSRYLQDKNAAPWAHTLSGILAKYKSIIAGKYKDKAVAPARSKRCSRSVTEEWGETLAYLKNLPYGNCTDGEE